MSCLIFLGSSRKISENWSFAAGVVGTFNANVPHPYSILLVDFKAFKHGFILTLSNENKVYLCPMKTLRIHK